MRTCTPRHGASLDTAIRAAIALSRQHGEDVSMSFNGADLVLNTESDPAEAQEKYLRQQAARMPSGPPPERQVSPEAVAAMPPHPFEAVKARMAAALEGTSAYALRWLMDAEAAGGPRRSEMDGVVAAFEERGFRKGACVGLHPDAYATAAINESYLVGQALAGFSRGVQMSSALCARIDAHLAVVEPSRLTVPRA